MPTQLERMQQLVDAVRNAKPREVAPTDATLPASLFVPATLTPNSAAAPLLIPRSVDYARPLVENTIQSKTTPKEPVQNPWILDLANHIWNGVKAFGRGMEKLIQKHPNALFATVIAGMAFAAYLIHAHNSSGTPSKQISKVLSSEEGAALQERLSSDLSAAVRQVHTMGVAPSETELPTRLIWMSEGNRIAASTRRGTSPNVARYSHDPTRVISGASPAHYASLNTLHIPAYLESISRQPTPNDIADNSAVVHEAAVR